MSAEFDGLYGGFGGTPKFPDTAQSHVSDALCGDDRGAKSAGNSGKTLEAMYRGGIFDHIGGGFCRYSTDEKWLAPHFEKMLYDNALLVMAYNGGI